MYCPILVFCGSLSVTFDYFVLYLTITYCPGYLAAEINAEGIRVPIEYEIPPAPNSTATESDLEVTNFKYCGFVGFLDNK